MTPFERCIYLPEDENFSEKEVEKHIAITQSKQFLPYLYLLFLQLCYLPFDVLPEVLGGPHHLLHHLAPGGLSCQPKVHQYHVLEDVLES